MNNMETMNNVEVPPVEIIDRGDHYVVATGVKCLSLNLFSLGICVGDWVPWEGKFSGLHYQVNNGLYFPDDRTDVYFTINEFAHPDEKVVMRTDEVKGLLDILGKRVFPCVLYHDVTAYNLESFYDLAEICRDGQWIQMKLLLQSRQYLEFFTTTGRLGDGSIVNKSLINVNGRVCLEMNAQELLYFYDYMLNASAYMERLERDLQYNRKIAHAARFSK